VESLSCFYNKKVKNDHKSFLRENWFEMSDLFSSLLIFTIIKTILSTFFTVSKFYKNLVKWALTEIECSVAGTTTLDREWYTMYDTIYLFTSNQKRVRVIVFNATSNNISVISWRQVLLVEETWIPEEKHRPVASHWRTL
jgi:hypothetical protein